MQLLTERLLLREWEPGDLPAFEALNSDPAVMEHFVSTLAPEQTHKSYDLFQLHFATYGYGFWVVTEKQGGPFLGFTGFNHPRFESFFTPCIEIGWRFCTAAWGKGYATEAAKACLEAGFRQLGMQEVYAFTTTTNKRSEKVMQRIGMQYQGEFDHPSVEKGHRLERHVLYKITPGLLWHGI